MENNPYTPIPIADKSKEKRFNSMLMKIIKWFLLIGGGLFLFIALLFGWVAFQTSQTHSQFEGVAEPFIQSFLEEQDPWAYEKAKPRLSERWLASVREEKSNKLFKYYNKLGRLESVESIEWKGCFTMSHTSTGTINRCNYLATAEYESATAHIAVGLVYEDESPKVVQLHVNSEAFLDQ